MVERRERGAGGDLRIVFEQILTILQGACRNPSGLKLFCDGMIFARGSPRGDIRAGDRQQTLLFFRRGEADRHPSVIARRWQNILPEHRRSGIAGALLAGFIGQSLGLASTANGAGFIGAIVGAFLILFIYRLILRRR